jgi:hypothetical protein
MGAATAAAAAPRNKVRRSSDALSCLISLDIIFSCLRSARSRRRRSAVTLRPGIFHVTQWIGFNPGELPALAPLNSCINDVLQRRDRQ